MTTCTWAWTVSRWAYPVARRFDNDKGNHGDGENNYDEADEDDKSGAAISPPRAVPYKPQ